METALRGLIEKFIDEGLKPERLKGIYQGLGDLLPLAKSKEDMLLGYFIGNIYGHLFYFVQVLYHREPTLPERVELAEIIIKRAPEIREKISHLI